MEIKVVEQVTRFCCHPDKDWKRINNQLRNKQAAFRRMCETKEFKAWHKLETARRIDPAVRDIEHAVDEAMVPENLRVEGRDESGRWMPLD